MAKEGGKRGDERKMEERGKGEEGRRGQERTGTRRERVKARPCSLRHDHTCCPQGLTASLAAELLLRDGPNALRPPRGTPEYVKFARQLAGGLQCLMWVAAAICLIAFAIQASEGDLTTDDNVSGACFRAGTVRPGNRDTEPRTYNKGDMDTETLRRSSETLMKGGGHWAMGQT